MTLSATFPPLLHNTQQRKSYRTNCTGCTVAMQSKTDQQPPVGLAQRIAGTTESPLFSGNLLSSQRCKKQPKRETERERGSLIHTILPCFWCISGSARCLITALAPMNASASRRWRKAIRSRVYSLISVRVPRRQHNVQRKDERSHGTWPSVSSPVEVFNIGEESCRAGWLTLSLNSLHFR